jgi:hypothetical protein
MQDYTNFKVKTPEEGGAKYVFSNGYNSRLYRKTVKPSEQTGQRQTPELARQTKGI